jgi:hypothetical protein
MIRTKQLDGAPVGLTITARWISTTYLLDYHVIGV